MGMFRGTTAAAVAAAVLSATAAANPPVPAAASDARGQVVIRYDEDVRKTEPGPHAGGGQTTANRYFDDVPDPKLIFRRRALHPGAAIGLHKLRHDEVYYVLAGRGELTVDEFVTEVVADAIYLREGVAVGIRTLGDADLEIIIAYPPVE